MALLKPCILYPIRFAATTYVVRVDVGGVVANLTFPSTGALTLGRNYWLSGDGQADADGGVGGVGDLYAILLATLNSHAGVNFSDVVPYTATNTTKITVSSGNFQILWAHVDTTLDPTLFGFTAASNPNPAANSTLSANTTQGIWYPNRPPAEDSRDRQPRSGDVATALSGLVRVSNTVASPKKERDIRFDLLTAAKALREYEDATDPFGSAEEMWLSGLSLGRPVRYYEDASPRTSTSYSLYRTRDLDDPIARTSRHKIRWGVDLRLRRAA
jgi:hypothetical protein